MAGMTDRKHISQGEGPARQAISLVMAVQADVAAGGAEISPQGLAAEAAHRQDPIRGLDMALIRLEGRLGAWDGCG